MRRLHHIGLEAKDNVVGFGIEPSRRQPFAVVREQFRGKARQELADRSEAVFLLDDAVDRHVLDAVLRAHARLQLRFSRMLAFEVAAA